jgi:uncharacterized membrane protein YfhO
MIGYVPHESNPFLTQNDLFRRATGLDGDLFTFVDVIHVSHNNYHVIRNDIGNYTYYLNDGESNGTLQWNYEASVDGMIYVYSKIDYSKQVKVLSEGSILRNVENSRPYIFSAGQFMQGQLVSITTDIDTYHGNALIYVAHVNKELFEQGYALLANEVLVLTEFTDTKVSGHVTVLEDGILYTSIPYQNRWVAYVDGVKSEILEIGGCMTAIRLNKGFYNIEFRYNNSILVVGAVVSVMSLIVFLVLIINLGVPGMQNAKINFFALKIKNISKRKPKRRFIALKKQHI